MKRRSARSILIQERQSDPFIDGVSAVCELRCKGKLSIGKFRMDAAVSPLRCIFCRIDAVARAASPPALFLG